MHVIVKTRPVPLVLWMVQHRLDWIRHVNNPSSVAGHYEKESIGRLQYQVLQLLVGQERGLVCAVGAGVASSWKSDETINTLSMSRHLSIFLLRPVNRVLGNKLLGRRHKHGGLCLTDKRNYEEICRFQNTHTHAHTHPERVKPEVNNNNRPRYSTETTVIH